MFIYYDNRYPPYARSYSWQLKFSVKCSWNRIFPLNWSEIAKNWENIGTSVVWKLAGYEVFSFPWTSEDPNNKKIADLFNWRRVSITTFWRLKISPSILRYFTFHCRWKDLVRMKVLKALVRWLSSLVSSKPSTLV